MISAAYRADVANAISGIVDAIDAKDLNNSERRNIISNAVQEAERVRMLAVERIRDETQVRYSVHSGYRDLIQMYIVDAWHALDDCK